ncbi:MAG: TadE/TadG family type IV pilus assembly protein [Methyloceanibacter sp.]|uniref:TadE/TadG family type IV pilus assembly protein n=1 Tax=Methyloceanibacter sp. TaxID=1965321 RepID=UPI003D6C79E5
MPLHRTPNVSSLGRLLRDKRGVSALEFALILPALLMLYVGAVEIGNALTIYRRTSQVAATAADLTAQVKQVTKSDVKDIQAAAGSILTPYSTEPLKIVLTSVVADSNNQGKVDWSCANKGGGYAKNSSYALPAGLTEPDSSVVVAEITYSFTPLLGLTSIFSPGAFDMERTFYTRPRRSLKVEKTDTGC